MVWLAGLLTMQQYRLLDKHSTLIRSSFFLIWVIFFSFSVSALFVVQKKEYELVQRKHFAEKLADEIDPYSETVLRMATNGFDDAFLRANFQRFYNENDKQGF